MKKLTLFMSLLLLAFVGIKANAAFYLCGGFQGWDPGNAVEMTDNGDGSFTYDFNVTSDQLQFKISTVKNSDWSQFNSGCYGDGDFTLNEEKTLNKGWTGNCKLPAAGELTLTIWDVNSSTCKAKVTPKGEIVVETIESMGIVGVEALGLSWSEDLEMALQAGSDHVWVATKEDVEIAAAGNYDYKARANHKWGFYELPDDGTNYQLNIAEAGTYDIVFTADTENHTLTAEATKQGGVDPQPVEITAVDLMGSSNGWAEPLASFTNGDASTGYWELNDVQFAANDEFKIRVSYSDQSEKWYVPVSDGNFLVDEDQLGHELTLTTEGGMNNMYVERNATLSFSLAPGFGVLFITGEIEPIPVVEITAVDLMGNSNGWTEPLASFTNRDASTGYWELNEVQFAADDEFKIRVSYSDQSEKWLVPESDGNFLVDENQLGQELTLTTEGGLNNMYVERNATLSFSLAPGFGALVITGEIEPIPAVEITAVDLMGSSNEWAEPLASFTNRDASTGYWELNDVQFAANDEFKIRVSYSDQSEKWLVPESDGNFLVDENQLGQELTLTDEGGMNNMYVKQDATLSFSLAPGFGALVITGEFVQPEPALTLHHGHDGQNDWQIVEFTYEDGIFTGTVALAEDEVFYFTNEAGAWFPTNENQGSVYELHSGWCTEIPLDGAGCQFFKMAEASTFTFIVQPFNEEYPQFDVEGWPAHDLEMYLYGNITDGGWENGTLMDVLEPNSHWLKYFTVEDVNNGNGYLKLGKAATFSDDTAIGAVDDADNYEVIAESAQALRALQIPMVDGGKAIEIAAGYYAMHVWYNAETGEGRVQFDPQNVPIGKVEILVPDDGLVIEQGQTLQLEAVYTPQYTTNADLSINWLSSDPSIATVDENGLVTALVPEANGAPRRAPSKNADNTVTITASMTNNDGSVIDGTIDITVSEPTGINDLVVDANVASVKYINAMGQMSDRAFDGLNIMVTTYIDGTTSTVKVVK